MDKVKEKKMKVEKLIEAMKENDCPPWLPERIILLSATGSTIYGTNLTTEEDPEGKGSDVDYRGICIPPEEYFFGLEKFSSFDNTGIKTFKTTSDITDMTVMHITKFVIDAMQSVPNNLELMYVDESNYVIINPLGRMLRSHREDFLSKDNIKRKFGRYAKNQKINMVHKTTRLDLVNQFGYDCKFAMHACRLFLLATELFRYGTMTLPCRDAIWLKGIRKGLYTKNQMEKIIDNLDDEMNRAYEKSELSPLPNYHNINKWLVDLNKQALEKVW